MKKLITILFACCLIVSLSACGTNTPAESASPSASAVENKTEAVTPAETEKAEPDSIDTSASDNTGESTESDPVPAETKDETPEAHSEVLVVVFSATGTTKGVA